MLFTSVPFVVFFVVFFVLYWVIFNRHLKLQNFLLLVGCYFFYAWSNWKLLGILIAISILNYFLGIYIEKINNENVKRRLLLIGLIQGIGGLFLYKYFDFCIGPINNFLAAVHINWQLKPLNWIAPIGISFFTFKTISYLLDISNRKISACKDWTAFFVYIAFFPTILSGPIDRARNFIPQLTKPRLFNYENAVEGLRQILWGLFKKSVIADNCATVTNIVFEYYTAQPASSLLIGAVLYSFQMYADFSGYSDMAVGMGRLLGFNVTKNFDYPFFAQNVAEYWRKWHMSLTSWLTEYVFTPLSISFRNFGNFGLILAIIINLTICGIWHGANWTYVLFGFIHGCYFIPLILKGNMNKKKKIGKDRLFPTLKEAGNMSLTFTLVTIAFIIFKSNSVHDALGYYKRLFSLSLFVLSPASVKQVAMSFFFIIMMMTIEWFKRNNEFGISQIQIRWPRMVRWSLYLLLFIFILVFGADTQQFVYVRF